MLCSSCERSHRQRSLEWAQSPDSLISISRSHCETDQKASYLQEAPFCRSVKSSLCSRRMEREANRGGRTGRAKTEERQESQRKGIARKEVNERKPRPVRRTGIGQTTGCNELVQQSSYTENACSELSSQLKLQCPLGFSVILFGKDSEMPSLS